MGDLDLEYFPTKYWGTNNHNRGSLLYVIKVVPQLIIKVAVEYHETPSLQDPVQAANNIEN